MKQCPLLLKYNYPYDADDGNISDWFRTLCDKCPLFSENREVGHCIDDYSGGVLRSDKERLISKIIPCPKCLSRDRWQVFEDDGLSCFHCGTCIYWYKSLPLRLETKKKVKK